MEIGIVQIKSTAATNKYGFAFRPDTNDVIFFCRINRRDIDCNYTYAYPSELILPPTFCSVSFSGSNVQMQEINSKTNIVEE